MTPVRIALIYLTLASLWILFSDRWLFGWVAEDSASYLFWQTAKGWLFVAVSSLIIYALASALNRALSRQLEIKRRHLTLMRRKAYSDHLTGLPNRRYGLKLVRELMRRARTADRGFSLMLLNLDDLKQVNDNLSYRAGDEVIRAVGQRLQERIGPGERLTRHDGDQFLLIRTDTGLPDSAGKWAETTLEALTTPFDVQGMELSISASAGLACYPSHATSSDELMRDVEVALRHSKQYKNCFNIYRPEFEQRLQHRFDLQKGLRKALEQDELTVHFQPIYDARQQRFTGAEALVRWPVGNGFIPPSDFIPVAEQSGWIRTLGNTVLERAFRETAALMKETGQRLRIAVNVSPKQFVNGSIVEDVRRALAVTGLDPSCVNLEITEGVLLSRVLDAGDVLQQLTRLGVTISMDDFGTGYSSLSYLRQHPFRYLKVDRSFIRGVDQSYKDRALVSSSVAMARALGLKVVAEGVETDAQRDILLDMGVDYLQGFLLARPMPASRYRDLLLQELANA